MQFVHNWIFKTQDYLYDKLELSEVTIDSELVLFNFFIRHKNGYAYSGGSDFDRNLAITKCLMECAERVFISHCSSRLEKEFLIDQFPTTNGFACHHQEALSLKASIKEAIERYLWTEWVWGRLAMYQLSVPPKGGLTDLLLQEFDRVSYYQLPIEFNSVQGLTGISFLAVIGIKNNGLFWGSSVSSDLDNDNWDHCQIEALRNLKSFESGVTAKSDKKEDVILNAFGKGGAKKFKPLTGDLKIFRLENKIKLIKSFKIQDGLWISRTIIEGFKENTDPENSRMLFW